MFVALIVIAMVVFTSLAAAAIYVGCFGPRSSWATDLQRAGVPDDDTPMNSLSPSDRASNEATKWI